MNSHDYAKIDQIDHFELPIVQKFSLNPQEGQHIRPGYWKASMMISSRILASYYV